MDLQPLNLDLIIMLNNTIIILCFIIMITEPIKKETVQSTDSNSQLFIKDWLSNRSNIFTDNVNTYDAINNNGFKDPLLQQKANGILEMQFRHMGKAGLLSTRVTGDDTNLDGAAGQFNKLTNSISIDKDINNIPLLDKTITHERTHSLRPYIQESVIGDLLKKHYVKDYSEFDKYRNNSGEIYARLMAFRKNNGLTPAKIVTKEDLQQWKKLLNKEDLGHYPKEFLLDLFNTVASNSTTKQMNGLMYTSNLT